MATGNHDFTRLRRALDWVIGALRTVAAGLRRILGNGRGTPVAAWALAPVNPDFLAYRAAAAAGRPVSELMPVLIRRNDVALARGHFIVPPPQPPPVDGICAFPPSYDRRAFGKVTPAWTTGKACGMCWTSASLASLESCFAPEELRDFSEAHMQVKNGWFESDPKASCLLGGNPELAAFYLAGWRGPVNETDFDPYLPSVPAVAKHVQNAWFLPDRTGPLDLCWIKLAVMHLGGVYSGISRSYGFHPDYPTYYNPSDGQIHAVTIVGWDDHFDRTKFLCNDPKLPEAQWVPPADGALIVKDNAGSAVDEEGFLYVSYYDGSIGTMMAVYIGEQLGNYTRIYQHDAIGVTSMLSVPADPNALPGHNQPEFSYQGNLFTAKDDESLVAVGFYEMVDPEMDYEILVYLDPDNGPVRNSGADTSVKVSLLLRGYYTVQLPKAVKLAKGQRFGIVLKGRQRAGEWPSSIPVEAPLPGTSSGEPVTAQAGESFVSYDGLSWQELTSLKVQVSANVKKTMTNTNLCIKGFTKSPLHVRGGLEVDAQAVKWTIKNDGSMPVRLQPVARRYRRELDRFERVGDDVLAVIFEDASGERHTVEDGWIDVAAGATASALSASGSTREADRITYNAYLLDRASNQMLIPDFWKYVLALIDHPPVVTSTSPPAGGHVNYLGLSEIRVTFDRDIKLGPSSEWISVTSAQESKVTMPMVSGKELRLVLATPLGSHQLGGTLWKVNIPATAVLETAFGEPMTQDYSWTFTVTGVN
jgi:C1A family cysteine protease